AAASFYFIFKNPLSKDKGFFFALYSGIKILRDPNTTPTQNLSYNSNSPSIQIPQYNGDKQ
ncbi:hypothetical protein, partial [Chryseobacterium sp. BIGb0232]|uniref:hypothetical protein n=1 Tax=Chryseobacterium sp. BIGb0232 TaxID=2940598 RepID=UPI001E591313